MRRFFFPKMKYVADHFVFSDGFYTVFNNLTFIYRTSVYSLVIPMSVLVCVSSSIASRGVRKSVMVYIHDWKDLFVLMCNVESPIDFGSRNEYFYKEKPFPYLTNVGRDAKRNNTMCGRP